MAKKSKVLFVIHSLGGGGAEKILVNIANNLDRERFDVTVMSIVDSGYHRDHLAENVRYRSLFSMPGGSGSKPTPAKTGTSGSLLAGKRKFKNQLAALYYAFWKIAPKRLLYQLAIRESYDVEVSFLEGICAKFVSGSWNDRSRKLCWIHVDVVNEGKSHRAFRGLEDERRCYEAYDGLVAVSEGVSESFVRYLGLAPERMRVIRNPLDTVEIKEGAKELLPPDAEGFGTSFTFCSIGRLCEQKAFHRLVKAASILKNRGYSFSVVILGEGKLEEELSALIEAENLGDTVYLLGFRKNPYAYLARSDAYVCTSVAEGMSTTVSEAIVLGLPIVSTRCAGMSELMAVARGELVDSDPTSIADGMARIMDSACPGTAEDLHRVEDFFDFDASMSLIECELLGEAGH